MFYEEDNSMLLIICRIYIFNIFFDVFKKGFPKIRFSYRLYLSFIGGLGRISSVECVTVSTLFPLES